MNAEEKITVDAAAQKAGIEITWSGDEPYYKAEFGHGQEETSMVLTALYTIEKLTWIAANGSPRLKSVIANEYNGSKLYKQERDAEFYKLIGVEGVVDAANARDDIRDSPSVDALYFEKIVHPFVTDHVTVWLKSDPKPCDVDCDYGDPEDGWTACEAVRVQVPWRDSWLYFTADKLSDMNMERCGLCEYFRAGNCALPGANGNSPPLEHLTKGCSEFTYL